MKSASAIAAGCAVVAMFLAVRGSGADAAGNGAGPVLRIVDVSRSSPNLLKSDAWKPWGKGFVREGDLFFCDNGTDDHAQRGAFQMVELDQEEPLPFVASVESRAEEVGGCRNGDYALHLDINYMDGSHLWSRKAFFPVGTHDWERREVAITPEKPVRSVAVYLLFRRHAGKAWFRRPEFHAQTARAGTLVFDQESVKPVGVIREDFLVRDVKAGSDFFPMEKTALNLTLEEERTERSGAVFIDARLRDMSGRDRAVTLYYVVPVAADGLRWFPDARLSRRLVVRPRKEYIMMPESLDAGTGRLSRYPLAAVADEHRGTCIGIDMAHPAFFRLGYNAGIGVLFIAWDIGLTPEKPEARVRFVRFRFEPAWGLRAALARYYDLFPEAFRRRVERQGLWIPFHKISTIRAWRDFGFQFKEGTNETAWDDKHGITTFRYTETSSWWMEMPKDMPRTLDAALAYARKLAAAGNKAAQALLTSGFYDEAGRPVVEFRNAPWCDGAVWSMNSMPGIEGDVTDFKIKWNPEIKRKYYGDRKNGDLDGEYIDSSEGFVTGLLDFRRDHFAAADVPLTFSKGSRRPALFCSLISFEYVRAIAREVHAMGKLMMGNSTPRRVCWLVPWFDVLGQETNWLPERIWTPMSDSELLYRRTLCKGKPYCFLMCADFHVFDYEYMEKYMKRCLAYGMFPGVFSPEYSQRSHYFDHPEFHDRDRPLFKRYVPLCKRLAEAGWEPIPLARSSDEHVYVERFGRRYLTVFNDSRVPRAVTITLDARLRRAAAGRELLSGKRIAWDGRGAAKLDLSYEDVAVIDLGTE